MPDRHAARAFVQELGAERETWTSYAGFLIATLGCAVGVGNVWRFAYVAGDSGGGAFLVVYVACVGLIGIPLMLAEFALGASERSDVVTAFGARGPWRVVGLLALASALLILSYYAVVGGWVLKYLFDYTLGGAVGPPRPVLWQASFLCAAGVLAGLGVRRGIERSSRLLMPLLAVIVLALASWSLTLPGARRGLMFLFSPDWSALARPRVYLAALGQALFSLGAGMGALLTYASYARRERLGTAATAIAIGDTLFALAAGVAIFPAVFAFGLDPAQGPALAFVTLPQLFDRVRGGRWVAMVFFLLLSGAALSSAVSLIEVAVAPLMRLFALPRPMATLCTTLAAFAAGVPSALSPSLLEAVDALTTQVLLPLTSIGLLLYVGWVLPRDVSMTRTGLRSHGLAGAWLVAVRYLAPAALAGLLAWSALS